MGGSLGGNLGSSGGRGNTPPTASVAAVGIVSDMDDACSSSLEGAKQFSSSSTAAAPVGGRGVAGVCASSAGGLEGQVLMSSGDNSRTMALLAASEPSDPSNSPNPSAAGGAVGVLVAGAADTSLPSSFVNVSALVEEDMQP